MTAVHASFRPEDPARELRGLCVGPPLLTLSVAESLTCGRIQAAIGAHSGASDFFRGGITAYALEEKIRHLGVDRAEASATNGVSAQIAAQMAIGACRMFDADLALATTGYAEPDPARAIDKPCAFFAIARRATTAGPSIVREGFLTPPDAERVAVQAAVAHAVLAALVEFLRLFRDAESRSRFAG